MSSPQATGSQALDKLKAILLNQEQKRIAYLEGEMQALFDQLNDKEKLIESLDPIIADLLYKKILESKSQMAEALAPVMGGAIRQQIAEAKDDMVDALYPVIGQAVRKSVAEAIKNLMQAINERIDSFLNQGFRAGKKVDRYLLLKQSLPFYVEEIFLIHKETGLLLAHASQNDENNGNEDMVSGMLTAIRQFSNAAFSANDQSLHEIEYEQFKIIIEDGKYAYLAFVVKGAVSTGFKSIIQDLENKIHLRFYKEMRAFEGDVDTLEPVKPILSGFISSVHEPLFKQALEENKKERPKGAVYLLVLILIAFSAYFFYPVDNNLEVKYNTLLEKFQKKHGSFFTSSKEENNIVLKGVLFDADRRVLINNLKELGLNVRADDLFILPDVQTLQNNLSQVQKELHLDDPISVIVDSVQIILQGKVANREKGLQAAQLFAAKASLPIIINDLTIAPPQSAFTKNDINNFTLYFEPASNTIETQSLKTLDSVIIVLNGIGFNKIIISGYADSVGPRALNMVLAQKRAEVVRDYLLKKNIPAQKIETRSYVFDKTANPSGFKSNRRVCFKLE
jgi:outer membrane protein OmpA-like peptidoglycan-associated protein